MKKINIILIIAAVAIIIAELILIVTTNLSGMKIIGPMLTITAMIMVIIQIVYNFRKEKEESNPKK
jgi:hypothetical protein